MAAKSQEEQVLQAFSTIAVSIFLEGLFFLLIGVFISSIIEVFVSEETIQRFIPRNTFFALISASLLGLFFPVCECGIVPVVHRLLKKGVPLHVCLTFLFASPIVNIVVLTSTYFAFPDMSYIVLMRFLGGLFIAITIGIVIKLFYSPEKIESLHNVKLTQVNCSCCCHDHNNSSGSCGSDTHGHQKGGMQRLEHVIKHAVDEFFDTGKFFIIGILITALIQSVVPRSILADFGSTFPVSNVFMIGFSYVLSVCSNTDAFIARSFLGQFNVSALLSFLVFGAMFDIKTTIMMRKIFNTKFIICLLLLVFSLTLIYSLLVEII